MRIIRSHPVYFNSNVINTAYEEIIPCWGIEYLDTQSVVTDNQLTHHEPHALGSSR
jgi:hypothetical protein